ncbi:MAG: DUF4349 domain-containing protein [Actinomycetia bacterium]|nr:DUF4349 domain-containing protein [Actinomycetes bacterium]
MTTTIRTRPSRWRRLLGLVVALTFLVTACGAGDDDRGTSVDDGDSSEASFDDSDDSDGEVGDDVASGDLDRELESGGGEEGADGAVADSDEGADPGVGGQSGSVPDGDLQPSDFGRKIVYTADVVVEVEDVTAAARKAQTAIAGLGGLVFGQETTSDPTPRTVYEFKVRPADFQEALSRLEGLGDLVTQTISADDVTERVVDLESRIITSELSVNRLRGFLEGATDLDTIAALERELLNRETDLETLRGQLRTLQDQVDLATIFLTLRQPTPPQPQPVLEWQATAYEGDDEGDRCPGEDDDLTIDEGRTLTLCVEVTNTGTTNLADIEIRDHSLDIDPDDFTFVGGYVDLHPGETLVAWAKTEVGAFEHVAVDVTAVAVDEQGEPLRIGVEVQGEQVELDVIEDDSLPGFVDTLTGSLGALAYVGSILILIVAALLPFIWVPFVLWAVARWLTRRQDARRAAAMPPPPQGPRDDAA